MSSPLTDVVALLHEAFGIDASDVAKLPGERDHNFRVIASDGTRFVLKLHHPDTHAAHLDLQDRVLAHVHDRAPGLASPRLLARTYLETAAGRRAVRLLSWVDGTPWVELAPDRRPLWELGATVARTDAALVDFDHPALDRPERWNLLQVDDLPPADHPWADDVLEAARDRLLCALADLPQVPIHNDANDHNVIVTQDRQTVLIDYGDVVRGPRIVSLGVAIAYTMFDQVDPLAAATEVVAGYHHEAPLEPGELALLDGVVRTRLAMSIANARSRGEADPDNAYLATSQPGIRRLVVLLDEVEPALAHAAYRDTCGYLPVAAQREVERHLVSGETNPHPVLDVDVADAQIVDWTTTTARSRVGDGIGIGRYGEHRPVYAAEDFATPFGERRTVHVGMDLFAPVATMVRSPFPGVVIARDVRPRPGDYGGVVLVEYTTPRGTPFWLLFGHLSPDDLVVETGDAVARGARIGRLGSRVDNGGWEPHLHVQLLTDLLGRTTDIDGVARASQEGIWRSISPSPAAVLVGIDAAATMVPAKPDTATIRARRRAHMSTSLSLSYRDPLHIVSGDKAILVDVDGRRWLDLVNNVAHVGHEHPRVITALCQQARRLNTNTRYLHGNVVSYARRLGALFPDPLNVVFLTNSGSESVDLALRLARTATGRDGMLTLEGAYHGNLDSTIAISPYKFTRAGGAGRPGHVRVCDLPDPYRGYAGDDGPAYAASVARQAADLEASGQPPAAFVHESISGCGGQVELATGYLEAAYAHARAAGAVCIADEVQCGFGRVGTDWWAFETHDVVPDIVTLGKPIGNGHPMGAVVTTPAIARAFRNGMEYFNTCGGNPVSAAVGLAVLDVIRDERLMAHATNVGARLRAGLDDLAARHDLVGDVRGRGLFLGMDLVADRATRAPATARAGAVVEAMKDQGVLCSTDGPGDNVVKFKPPMVITADQVDHVVPALDEALASAR